MTNLTELYRIDNFNDTFALGHYARVLDALDKRGGRAVAFKALRSEHLSEGDDLRWEYKAFANEANLLMKLADSDQVVKLFDCGYIENLSEAPSGGEIASFQLDVLGFIRNMTQFASQGWRPYLALENLPRTQNLFYLMKPNRSGTRWRLPSEEGLELARQFAELLKEAHGQGLVYLDHKLEHVYWDGNRLNVIDFNSSRLLEGDLTTQTNQQYFRMDLHNLCVGILYPIFTGLAPQKAALRPQPGTWRDVETRYQDIQQLDFGVEPTLSEGIKHLLNLGASAQLESVDDFLDKLADASAPFGWDYSGRYIAPASRDARSQMRAGLERLREGQENLREARDLFREAAIQEGLTPDLEQELRRLVVAVNEMLNQRVIP
ncbi:MAG: hypothetical protein K8L99_15575 [Anaerolineae bacterium]|nr:hypothetical protein [Anaerolineae bacterium]